MAEQQSESLDTTQRLMVPQTAFQAESAPASLVVLSGWEIGRAIRLPDSKESIIGRAPELRCAIPTASISRHHCRIRPISEDGTFGFLLIDMGSTNGTFVNGVRIESARLRHGDNVRLGDVVLKFLVQDPVDSEFYQQVHRLIHFDRLTGLLTRESFTRYVEAEIERDQNGPFTVAMTDMDGLKQVNDRLGHLAGSSVIEAMGGIIRKTIREHDLAGIYGGDEAMILYRQGALPEAAAIAERIRIAIAEHTFEYAGNALRLTITQGLAEWPRHGAAVGQLVAAADKALYAAKQAGRNCIRTADD